MILNAGKMVHRVRLEERTSQRDASGQLVDTWRTVLNNIPVEIRGTSGGERIFGVQMLATTSSVLITHFMPSVAVRPEMRCVGYQGRVFNITSALDPDGQRRVLVIQATEEV